MAGGGEDENIEAFDKAGDQSSDDDIEIVPKSVDNYWLEHGDETPVSFATLPFFKTVEETMPDEVVYVRGTQDNGMRLYMRAVAWKLEFTEDIKPVFHLKTEKYWIQLLKPRKSYEETIRSIMSVAQFLNYAAMNPIDPERVAWSHVKDVFTSWEVAPSRNDLPSHLPVIRHLIVSDERLASSLALQTIDTGVSRKRLASASEDGRQSSSKGMYVSDDEENVRVEPELHHEQKKVKFEVDDLNTRDEMDGGEEDEVGDLSETVCCICDNGGAVICCDGPCMRSFHLNKDADGAPDTHCSTLGFSKGEAERMDKFLCPNCKLKKHQCYACGQLGRSDESAGDAQEVFVCDAAMCGHFYHPTCVAELILKDKDTSEQSAMVESIKEGKGFVCPMHKCLKCGKGEVKEDEDLQFGICRRCPRVWHRKCLPTSLTPRKPDGEEEDDEGGDDDDDDDDNDEPQRAWDNLLPNRILLYCNRHTIIPKLGTPARSHVKFPEGSLPSAKKTLVKSKAVEDEKKRKLSKSGSLKKKDEVSLKSTPGQKARKLLELDTGKKRELSSSIGQIKAEGRLPTKQISPVILIKGRTDVGASPKQEDAQKFKGRSVLDAKLERTSSMVSKPSTPRESALQRRSKPPVVKAGIIDSETRGMVDDIVERAKASVTIESVRGKHEIPACYRRHSKNPNPDKKYSLFKIESIIKGMRKAVETLDNGGSIEDAKAKCSPDFIKFIEVCRNDLKVYLSPFLHGARYTSYGRHFTKPEKLDEIVDRLQWYVEKGDMVVDFCCGANEFSLRMKKKMEETGKNCEYKNFDLIQTNNDFNFSKRDWFQVKQNELPDGNRLIMGLNPPFGVKGHLANQFIDHALKFRPKLIVLIVPKETERLDRKHDMYDLVWEDSDLLGGQSFYLPGSVDVNENPLNDWNIVTPPLYVWSRPDWTVKHKQTALDKGHISPNSSSRFVGSPWKPPPRPPSPLDIGVEKDWKYTAPVEVGGGEDISDLDRNKNCPTQVEPMFVNESTGGSNLDGSNSSKLKDQKKRDGSGIASASTLDTQVKDNSSKSSKVKTTTKYANSDGYVPQKWHEKTEGRRVESSKKASEESSGFQATQYSSKNAKNEELAKGKSPEGHGHLHAKKLENARHNAQESAEKARHSFESRHDVSRKERKSNDRFDRGDDIKNDVLAHDGHQRKRTSEKYRPSMETDLGRRKSPNRHDRYEPARRKSPDKYDRHGISRHAEDRKASPERSRHRSIAGEHRKGSPEKSRYSSVVDLEKIFSSNSARNDRSRDYDDFSRSTDKDYQDSTSYRAGSPNRRYVPEDGKKSWVNTDSYQGASENHALASEYLNKDYMNSGLPKTYDDIAHYGLKQPESQLSRDFYGQEALGVLRQDPYTGLDVQRSGRYDNAAFTTQNRHTDLYQPEPPRGMFGVQEIIYTGDRYGVPLQTEGLFRASGAGGVGALPEQSFQPPHQYSGPVYPSVYGSIQSQQQAPMGFSDSSLLSNHNLFDNRLAHSQTNLQYPPIQERLPGQANKQFSGGWFED